MSAAVDDELWSAIGDPIRRRLLDLLLAEGFGTPTSLSDRLPITRQAVTKHLGFSIARASCTRHRSAANGGTRSTRRSSPAPSDN